MDSKLYQYYGIVFFVICGINLWGTSRATDYSVGGAAGWDISSDLGSWPAGINFNVGDVLVFQFSSLHSVCYVNKTEYDTCDASNAIQSNKAGNFSFPLSTPGPNHFICGTLSHCLGGMKLLVHVNGPQNIAPGPMSAGEDHPSTTTTIPGPAGTPNSNKTPLPNMHSLGQSHNVRHSLTAAAGFGFLITIVLIC